MRGLFPDKLQDKFQGRFRLRFQDKFRVRFRGNSLLVSSPDRPALEDYQAGFRRAFPQDSGLIRTASWYR